MRHAIIVLTVVSLLFGIDSSTADDAGWYLGVGIGDVAANYKFDKLNTAGLTIPCGMSHYIA